jgi:hypothetical protein
LDHDVQVAGFGDDARGEPRLVAEGFQYAPQAACLGERDDRLVAQDAERYGPACGERVLGVDHENRGLAGHDDRVEVGRGLLARAETDERGLQVAGRQPVEQRVGLVLHEGQFDAGVPASERADRADDAPVRQRHDQPDPQPAGDQPPQRRDRLLAVLDLRERGAGVGQQCLAGRGQRDRAPVTVQQPFTEFGLQAPDLLTDGGLGYA